MPNRIIEVQEPIAIGCDATDDDKNYKCWLKNYMTKIEEIASASPRKL
jgi:hypothetical protein